MKFTKAQYKDVQSRWPDMYAKDYNTAIRIVYSWVKQDKINPVQMSELQVDAYKHFVY